MKIFPGNVGWSLYRACGDTLDEAVDCDDAEAERVLTQAMGVWTAATNASKPSVRHADCARRRMAMALAWCVEHIADAQPPTAAELTDLQGLDPHTQ